MGSGLFLYNATSLQYEASWGDQDRVSVFDLLYVEELNHVIALTCSGIYTFDAGASTMRLFDCMDYSLRKDSFRGQIMNVGTVVANYSSGVDACRYEVWLCSHEERMFFIVNPSSLSIIEVVEFEEKEKMSATHASVKKSNSHPSFMLTSIKYLQAVEGEFAPKLGVANNWELLLWDVGRRTLEHTFNCMEYCKENQDSFSGTVEPIHTHTHTHTHTHHYHYEAWAGLGHPLKGPLHWS